MAFVQTDDAGSALYIKALEMELYMPLETPKKGNYEQNKKTQQLCHKNPIKTRKLWMKKQPTEGNTGYCHNQFRDVQGRRM